MRCCGADRSEFHFPLGTVLGRAGGRGLPSAWLPFLDPQTERLAEGPGQLHRTSPQTSLPAARAAGSLSRTDEQGQHPGPVSCPASGEAWAPQTARGVSSAVTSYPSWRTGEGPSRPLCHLPTPMLVSDSQHFHIEKLLCVCPVSQTSADPDSCRQGRRGLQWGRGLQWRRGSRWGVAPAEASSTEAAVICGRGMAEMWPVRPADCSFHSAPE